ncbi:MAG: PilZ domain-containing protein [Alphaproteobacteria bacterium]|nr:MAG: PilZ domain-containing protein [Alphaproteobacteria bacterium]
MSSDREPFIGPPDGEPVRGDTPVTPRVERYSVMLTATIEHFGGAPPSRHRVRDISPDGMRVDQARRLRAGATILVTVGDLTETAATVMWVRNDAAGLKFASPIQVDRARSRAAIAPCTPERRHRSR